jgi:tRNA-2-methylthio-N6-dimethylallyladenosine synthase
MSELQEKILDERRQGESFAPFKSDNNNYGKFFYIESYGCAMNFSDSEIVASILYDNGYGATKNAEEADLILLNTCSIREKAEQTVRNRLRQFNKIKKENKGLLIGVLGCMAERLKDKLVEQEHLVDMVIGPDAYRTLPQLIVEAKGGQKSINVLLSREETYADISPVRLDSNGVSAFVSIMRGCNNMCSFCVVPFTRGRERSRDVKSILQECEQLFNDGFREITLLGQNVDSYYYTNEVNETTNFAHLLELVAQINPLLRVRFSTSHPKDITDDVLHSIAKYENICKYIHLPIQSGSTRLLALMNRTYTKEWYEKKIEKIWKILPGCAISTDIIVGFCTETEEDHQDTLAMFDFVKFDLAYMYAYSERPGTLAARRYDDDVAEDTKARRLAEVIKVHREHCLISKQNKVGKTFKVLVEGTSKKNEKQLYGRNDLNDVVIFDAGKATKGDYIHVKIDSATSGTLIGTQIIEY